MLNAKQHEREALIVEQAGVPGSVTIATNMAGRGTDIVLGGNLNAELAALPPEADAATRAAVRAAWQVRHDAALAAGGLHIIGTERHESRRIDNQLRGRSGRQGDPGSSRFFLSMEDNLMRIFGDPVRTKRLLQMAGMKEGDVMESGMLTRQIEKAQRKVESHNFDIRKTLLQFDDVANDQRKVVYQQRTEIMGTEDLSAAITGIREEAIGTLMDQFMPKTASPQEWDLTGLGEALERDFGATVYPASLLSAEPELEEAALRQRVVDAVAASYEAKVARTGAPIMRHVEKDVMLHALDRHWREHLSAMDYLRQGIHLRGYAQKDYRFEYKREAFELFAAMLDRVKFDTVSAVFKGRGPHPGRGRARRGAAARPAHAGPADPARRGAVRAAGCPAAAAPPRRRGPRYSTLSGDSAGVRSADLPVPAMTSRRPLSVRIARWAAMSPARAARARNSSTVTACSPTPSSVSGPATILVVAGALCDTRGRVLIAQRAPDKHMAGRWEFPGGKVGVHETEDAALIRELREELGVQAREPQFCLRLTHAYPDRTVHLSCWIVRDFVGEPQGLEGQQLKWVPCAALADEDILEADRPFIEALQRLVQ